MRIQMQIVGNCAMPWEQRMRQALGSKVGRLFDKVWKHIVRMLVGVAGNRCQRLQFPDGRKPDRQLRAETPPPALGCQQRLQAIEDDVVKYADKQVVSRFQELHDAVQPGDGARRRHARLLELRLQLQQSRAGETARSRTQSTLQKTASGRGRRSRLQCAASSRCAR